MTCYATSTCSISRVPRDEAGFSIVGRSAGVNRAVCSPTGSPQCGFQPICAAQIAMDRWPLLAALTIAILVIARHRALHFMLAYRLLWPRLKPISRDRTSPLQQTIRRCMMACARCHSKRRAGRLPLKMSTGMIQRQMERPTGRLLVTCLRSGRKSRHPACPLGALSKDWTEYLEGQDHQAGHS